MATKVRKTKKNNSTVIFLIFLLLTGLLAYILFNGLTIGKVKIGDIKDSMTYGLDLTGGVSVVLEPKEGQDVTDEKIEGTISAIQKRVDTLGVSEATVTKYGDNRIRVQIPSIQDQQEAMDLIGKTAQLEFKDPDGNVLLTGEDVEDAKAVKQENKSGVEESVVSLTFTEEGKEKFAKATKDFLNKEISIELDGEVISSPTVNAEITNGKAVIEGMSDYDEASNLADLIKGGSLPLELEFIEVNTVGPSLGQGSLDTAIKASAIGIALVLIFMLIVYRGFGLAADLALIWYIIIYLLVFLELGVTLSLPGIAGMILSVGMAVDSNVIIFERIKEETRAGLSLHKSTDIGFKQALRTIVDSNITTLIAGFVLFYLGSGSVQGFAVTLIAGIIISMFTAVILTKHIANLVIDIAPNEVFLGISYGTKPKKKKKINMDKLADVVDGVNLTSELKVEANEKAKESLTKIVEEEEIKEEKKAEPKKKKHKKKLSKKKRKAQSKVK